ncbi:MAG: capsular polysaccharide biosynthesis protein CapF [Leptolyngbyaceae cyanobacterium SU_3_3]|nr:capsular polysaccharide biosynthesis protein CapF [Leptolyngbyaceae cyanobacterium SU_3_3]
MQVLVTGASGFVGRNLCLHLSELEHFTVIPITRQSSSKDLREALTRADFIVHLAGVNRPQDPAEFDNGNTGFTQQLCETLAQVGRSMPITYTSSTQAELDNPYGQSKRAAEDVLLAYQQQTSAAVYIYRLPNVFGKWCKPNYNSAVATFCHNIARDLPITVNNSAAGLNVVYVDDVIHHIVELLQQKPVAPGFQSISSIYQTTVGEVVDILRSFRASRDTLITDRVGTGFIRALYSTYVSYLPTSAFSYKVPKYGDDRGVFVEMLKTPDAGQFSFFTAHPGITRGDHYHHTKTEKFLVIKGHAHFGFRNVLTGESYELCTNGADPEIVETVPGWTHNITNIGEDEMIVMLWANEIFDRNQPDTIAQKV